VNVDAPTRIRRLGSVSPQRWLLGALAAAAAIGSSIVAGVSGGGLPPVLLLIVAVLAVGSAVWPHTHTALVVIAVVVWQWIVVVDDPTGPAVVAVALALLVFHSVIAVMANVPPSARLDAEILRRWLRRVVLVAAATVATWALVLLMEQRSASGSVVATLAGFVTALALVVVLRAPGRDAEP
jgi:hypothetical protein